MRSVRQLNFIELGHRPSPFIITLRSAASGYFQLDGSPSFDAFHANCQGKDRSRVVDLDGLTIGGNLRRTFRPRCANDSKPLIQHRPESSGTRILHGSQLAAEAVFSKHRDRFLSFRNKAAIAQPHEEVQDGGRSREDLDGLQIGWNWMSQDFLLELCTEDDDVFKVFEWSFPGCAAVVPNLGFP